MTSIQLNDVSLSIPLLNHSTRSLKALMLKPLSRRRLDRESGRAAVRALNNVTLDLPSGSRLALRGPNGAGKSTLLRLIAGIYVPTSGQITCDGTVTAMIDMNAGMMHQATGRENVYLRGGYLRLGRKALARMIDEIEEFTQLGEFFDLPISTYSAGMVARLSFAINTAIEPEILLIDEGIGVGDAQFQAAAQSRLDNFKTRAKILVMASHSEPLLHQFCTHYVDVEHGEVSAPKAF